MTKAAAKRLFRSMVHVATLGALLLVVTHIAQTSGTPQVSIQLDDARLVSCDVPSGLVYVQANAPTRVEGGGEPRVTFTGLVETPRDYCGDEVRILGQRKVCGAFGCHYHTIERSPYVEFDRIADLRLFHSCKSGTHRYRTVVDYTAPNVRNPQNRFFVQDRHESELITCPEE